MAAFFGRLYGTSHVTTTEPDKPNEEPAVEHYSKEVVEFIPLPDNTNEKDPMMSDEPTPKKKFEPKEAFSLRVRVGSEKGPEVTLSTDSSVQVYRLISLLNEDNYVYIWDGSNFVDFDLET